MKNKLLFSTLVVLMLVVSACGSAAPTAAPVIPITGSTPVVTSMPATSMPATVMPATAMPATAMPVATPTSAAEVDLGQNTALGSFLVDSAGKTLYVFTNDTPGTSTCTGNCASTWPPLLTNGAPTTGTGVTASMLGTTTRADGSVQVTYNGWPLYYYSKDMAAGDTNGEGLFSKWYVMTAAGTHN
jgi:predicted lipoprotein with Yx(FWY)xxD motif